MKNIFKIFLPIFVFFFLIAHSVLAVSSWPVNPYSFTATPGDKSGTIKITWYDDGSLDTKYNLYYGTSADNYIYAVPNLYRYSKQINEFLVESLIPNQIYYFKLDGISGGTYTTSGPIMAKASSCKILASSSVTKKSQMPYNFSVSNGSKSGTVNISWTDNGTADKYSLVYGTKLNEYLYGAHSISFQKNLNNTYTVGSLVSGKTYYFALVAEKGDSVLVWSQPLSIIVK